MNCNLFLNEKFSLKACQYLLYEFQSLFGVAWRLRQKLHATLNRGVKDKKTQPSKSMMIACYLSFSGVN